LYAGAEEEPVMKRIVLAVIVAGLVLPVVARAARAQGKPDFSGTWTMDVTRSHSPTYPDFIGPVTLIIKQTPTELSIETRRGEKRSTLSGTIEDSESKAAGGSGATAFRSYWDGTRLVSETIRNVNESTVRAKEVRSLDAGGREMTIETTLIVEHGYALSGAKNYSTGKDVFKKVN
jgi:hypothetical protein